MKLNRTFSIVTKILVVTAIAVGVHFFFRVVSPPSQACAREHLCEQFFSDVSDGSFWGSADDEKLSNLTTNLQSIRAQLELYRLHHGGSYPANITDGLTRKTKSDGTVDASGAYGPYMCSFPANAFVDDPVEAVKTSGGPGEGWSYDPETGVFVANTPGHEDL